MTHGGRVWALQCALLASFGCGEPASDAADAAPSLDVVGAEVSADAVAQLDGSMDSAAEVDGSNFDAVDSVDAGASADADATGASGDGGLADATLGPAQPLALATAWTPVSTDQDPWWPQAQATAKPCTPKEVLVEEQDGDQWYEVKTTGCNYWTASQPTLESIEPGDAVVIRVYRWKILDGDGGYKLTLAMAGDPLTPIWQETLAVPGKSGLWAAELPQKSTWPKGSDIYWHVENHGINSWNLIEVSVRKAQP